MIVVIAAALGGGDNGDSDRPSGSGSNRAGQAKGKGSARTPKTYEVQSGDTLTSIARETGVPVSRILRLNPGVDPQILIAGEKLKLR